MINMKDRKTIDVSIETWKKIHKWRMDLGYKTADDVIKGILKIVTAKQLEENKK